MSNKITISENKTALRMFKYWNINPNYYKDILLNNQDY